MIWTDEMKQFLSDNIKGTSYKKMTELINTKFNINLSDKVVSSAIKRYGLKNGIDGSFRNGHIPYNNGLKMSPETYKKVSRTMFKKGNMPPQHRPVGSERIDKKEGYIYVKIAEPNKWKLKHRWIWEQHNGHIPKGSNIIFKDGDRLNCDINNLMLVERRYMATVNKNKLISDYPQITETGIAIAKLMVETNQKRKINTQGKN